MKVITIFQLTYSLSVYYKNDFTLYVRAYHNIVQILPLRTSEQGNVMDLMSVYIILYMCESVQKKIL